MNDIAKKIIKYIYIYILASGYATLNWSSKQAPKKFKIKIEKESHVQHIQEDDKT